MRKFTVALLAVALVLGFTMSASAADVKLGGSYYVKSLFESNHALQGNDKMDQQSQAFTHQRLRIQPEVAIADGLKLVMRFDALEKVWGSTEWTGSTSYDNSNRVGNTPAKVQENIEFERAYIDFNTGYGKFMVGYQNFAAWGTDFLDTSLTRPGVKYIAPVGNWVVIAAIEKGQEKGRVAYNTYTYCGTTGTTTTTATIGAGDADTEIFDLGAIYKLSNGEAGLLWQAIRDASSRNVSVAALGNAVPGMKLQLNALIPYYKGTFGNIYVEAEGVYAEGKLEVEKPVPAANVINKDYSAFGAYANVKADLGAYYVGGMAVYAKGDDIGTTDKVEGGLATSLVLGQAFSPALMMWNDQFLAWAGTYSKNGATMNQFMDNCVFTQLYAGFKPTAKSEYKVAYAVATADQIVIANQVSKDIGKELDVTATYKIYDNLAYELGAGYFWVGDYFKGNNVDNKISNDYLLYHKLTLNF